MKKANINDMEMGNFIFGHSRGEYLVEPRGDYQELFIPFLYNNGFDGYGFRDDGRTREFENDTFIIRTYYWGEDGETAKLPNFVYKPINLEIRWYKYPMRDAYSNQDIDTETFKVILKECERSLNEKG